MAGLKIFDSYFSIIWLNLLVSVLLTLGNVASFSFKNELPSRKFQSTRRTLHKATRKDTTVSKHSVGEQRTEITACSNKGTNEKETTIGNQQFDCKFCSKKFASRNALFRHIRLDPDCSRQLSLASEKSSNSIEQYQKVRLLLAISIAYVPSANLPQDTHTETEARKAGNLLQRALVQVLRDEYGSENAAKLLSFTQTSVANQRHRALSQETGVAAARDVVVLHLSLPLMQGKGNSNAFVDQLIQDASGILATNSNNDISVHLLGCQPLTSPMHAEGDCTQRVYHYLLPLSWLPNGKAIQTWWLQEGQNSTGVSLGPPGKTLRLLREAFRSAESVTIPNRRVRRKKVQLSNGNTRCHHNNTNTRSTQRERLSTFPDIRRSSRKGRSSVFANKERRPWHNFADPELRGDASPNQEPVWRVLDAARIQGFISSTNDIKKEDEVVAILEFRGDDFVQGQIRTIVATALAMTHGWLPMDFFERATQKDLFISNMPVAPAGRLYMADARFHFHERGDKIDGEEIDLVNRKRIAMDKNNCTKTITKTSLQWVQDHILNQRASETNSREEEVWLQKLRHDEAPRVRNQILLEQQLLKSDDITDGLGNCANSFSRLGNVPKIYHKTLGLLREIVKLNSWPETSNSRSDVIRNKGNRIDEGTSGKSGSFTVYNPKQIKAMVHEDNSLEELPIGNVKFPDLVKAVFELEEAISSRNTDPLDRANIDGTKMKTTTRPHTVRPPSLCCAINSNAQFSPHVDSGRGAGQSLSMIVGLGDYIGGEIFVEGIPHDIRFNPLEFDGWSSRHWTNRYRGERFSLVWFSPELKASKTEDQ